MEVPCEECGEATGNQVVRDEGKSVTPCGHCQDCRRKHERRAAIARGMKGIGIPTRFAESSLENYHCPPGDRQALGVVRRWALAATDGAGLVIGGGVGSGKTHLAVAATRLIARRLLEFRDFVPERVAFYANVPVLMDQLRDAVNSDASGDAVLRPYCEIDLLLLDDLGAERGTEFERDRIRRLVSDRWDHCRSTIVTTNTFPDDWDEVMGERTASRLRGIAGGGRWIVGVDAFDYREISE